MVSENLSERSRKTAEAAKEFVKASEKLLTRDIFFDATELYSGSLYPAVRGKIDTWRQSGVIPIKEVTSMYSPGAVADLSSIGAIRAREPRLSAKFSDAYEKNKAALTREDLYGRVAEYQDALMRLASSSTILRDTISAMTDDANVSVETAKTNLDWIKRTVTASIAKVYQAFGKLFDKVTQKIDEIIGILSGWTSELKKALVERFRELAQHFLELLNGLVSALFGWISKLKEIAQERGFRLNKVTVTIDPLEFASISIFGFSVPIPVIRLPKIEMEFS